MRRAARIAAALAALVALVAVAGWLTHIEILKSFYPAGVGMNPATALGFMLSAASLWLIVPAEQEERGASLAARRLSRLCAAATLAIGLLALARYWLGVDVPIDILLYRSHFGPHPGQALGRIALTTAADFVLVGAGLLLVEVEIWRGLRPTEWLGIAAGAAAFQAFIGYLFGLRAFYGGGGLPIALSTVLAFLLMVAGLWCSRPERGLMRLLASAGPGGRLARRLVPAAVVIPLVVGWLLWAGEERDLFSSGYGLALLVTATAVALAGLVYLAGLQIDRTEGERGRLERERDRFFNLPLALLCVAGFDGYFKRINPAWEQVLGYNADELQASPFLEFVHPEDRPRTAEEMLRLLEGKATLAFENRYRAKDGSYRWLLWRAFPSPEEGLIYATALDITARKRAEEEIQRLNGELENRVVERTSQLASARKEIADGASERRRLQEQLFHSQKMEAIGRLAGGVAHDFNNLLTIIGGYSQLLLDRVRDDKQRGQVEEIKKASDRAASLTQQLLAFSRQQMLRPQVLDLNSVVANMEKMLRRLIGEDVELRTVMGTNLWPVKADAGQIEQVIMNLAVNARDAMPSGGMLTLETANTELDAAYAKSHFPVAPGRYVMLAVSDNGCGMNEETQKHIFEPFFTTKEQGKGTGLGLATVYGIVKQSGGFIWVYSVLGQGTTFKVYLPCIQPEAEKMRAKEVAAAAAAPFKGETILLAEDEDSLRALARQMLESQGYEVLDARSGPEALEIARQRGREIKLLLTDVVMPKMGGRELAQQVTALHPHIKILFMSGYTDDAIVHHGVLESGAAFVQKPFTPDGLAFKVRQALGG